MHCDLRSIGAVLVLGSLALGCATAKQAGERALFNVNPVASTDVRVLGAIGVVELHAPVDMERAAPAFVEQGVWIRPFGKLVYTMPPYVIDPVDLRRITDGIRTVVAAIA